MIKKLDNSSREVALQMKEVFYASYKVEAELLGADDFPPLRRPLKSYMDSMNDFFAFWQNERIAAIVESGSIDGATEIHSLVVHPDYFRQGMGKKLMQYVLGHYQTKSYIVETGADNVPATRLYENLGFRKTKEWDTEIGIRKIRLVKQD